MTLVSEVVVAGAGAIGLSCCAALADAGFNVTLLAPVTSGEASAASAGILAPSVAPFAADVGDFFRSALQLYPETVARLRDATGIDPGLRLDGVLELALSEDEARDLERQPHGRLLDREEIAAIEPAVAHACCARLHEGEGAVNPLEMMRALKHLVGTHPRVTIVPSGAVAVERRADSISVRLADASSISSGALVLAAGAWSPGIDGLPRTIPIAPLRGQMMSVVAQPAQRVIFAAHGYVVPQADGRTLLGATSEDAGFEPHTTPEGMAELRTIAGKISPELRDAPMLHAWAGLRPMTPDGLPIIGRDPAWPSLIYACGHSRNGILLAPITGQCVAGLLAAAKPAWNLSAFGPERFQ